MNMLKEVEIDSQTLEAVDIIKHTGWLEESTSTQPTMQPIFDARRPLPTINQWKRDINKQNKDMRDNIDPNENDEEDLILNPTLSPVRENIDVGLSMDACDDIDLDEIAAEIIQRYSLNRKQRYAFEISIKNKFY